MVRERMEDIYSNMPPDCIPWNIETPPPLLVELIESGKVRPCKTIEFGCGAGNHAVYLAARGFDVTGIDFSRAAIAMAEKSALDKGVSCRFIEADVISGISHIEGAYDFALDWEVLHHIFPEFRETFVRNVVKLLNPGALYLSVCFSEKSPQFGGEGKYRKTPMETTIYFSSEEEIRGLMEPHFSVEELKTVVVEGRFAAHKAVWALMRKK